MQPLRPFTIGQLSRLHSGKVREIYEVDPDTLLMIATDRISAFDQVLESPIPSKGVVLDGLSAFWFHETSDIVPNHFIRQVDPCASLVRRVEPIRVEMVVRGHVSGSMWRRYSKGERTFSGQPVPDGLGCNAPLPSPLVNPTTKEASDREITPAQIVSSGLASQELYDQMEATALALFKRGSQLLASRGLILVDTKYEFGLLDGQLTLIDEIHTPDSSRFWWAQAWERDPEKAPQLDKELVRAWLLKNRQDGNIPRSLPEAVVRETTRRYREIFQLITGGAAPDPGPDPNERLYRNLVSHEVIRDGFVLIVMGSPIDQDHCKKIKAHVESYGIAAHMRVASAHKNAEDVAAMASFYNLSLEPGAGVAVAGLSNGLGGALAANLNLPVVNSPPFKDRLDLLININSSLMLPSKTPAGTVVRPESAAMLALRSLNIHRLRRRFQAEITSMKEDLRTRDREMRAL